MKQPDSIHRYLVKRGVQGPWRMTGTHGLNFQGAVVIPSLAEGENLFATLASLAENPAELCARFLVVVVINQRVDASAADIRQNQLDLERLAETVAQWPFPLGWIDASSPGRQLPGKRGGVGLARKIGLDLTLERLDWSREPLLANLDADTLTEPNYLQTLCEHFARASTGAAILPIRHQPAEHKEQQVAIDRYELFLRSYVLGLAIAGSPYAFMTVGSAMACTARAYLMCGGMNTRSAAEDFYFLDKLAKTAGVSQVNGTTVHPSSRISQRVPFGTGRSISDQLCGQNPVAFYPAPAFFALGRWLDLVKANLAADADLLLAEAYRREPVVGDYLSRSGWLETWPRMQRTHRGSDARLAAFHRWFDGLKTLRLIHAVCDQIHPRSSDDSVLTELFASSGLPCPAGVPAKLEVLRTHQNGMYTA